MSNFLKGFSEIDFGQQNGNNVQYIKPQTAHVCTINVDYKVANTGTNGLTLTFTNESGSKVSSDYWITESSFLGTAKAIKWIAESAGVYPQLETSTNRQYNTHQEWVETIASVLNDVKVVAAFKGEEYINNEAVPKVKAVYWRSFPVTDMEAALEFMAKNSATAIKKLPQTATTADFPATTKDPFAIPVASPATPVGNGVETPVDPFAVNQLPF